MSNKSYCPHVTALNEVSKSRLLTFESNGKCQTCLKSSPNLWICLTADCFYIGCGESVFDHSLTHSQETNHFLTLNLRTKRIWCYKCELEVYESANNPPVIFQDKLTMILNKDNVFKCNNNNTGNKTIHYNKQNSSNVNSDSIINSNNANNSNSAHSNDGGVKSNFRQHQQHQHHHHEQHSNSFIHHQEEENEDEDDSNAEDNSLQPRGISGLRNMGNTCYMNAAIQSLSNCPPLTSFFLDCSGHVLSSKKSNLSKAYLKLLSEIWSGRRPIHISPTSFLSVIKQLHPIFRGYLQHDSQEFLRYLMDNLHEELKENILLVDDYSNVVDSINNTDDATTTNVNISKVNSSLSNINSGVSNVKIYSPNSINQITNSDIGYETSDSIISSEVTSSSKISVGNINNSSDTISSSSTSMNRFNDSSSAGNANNNNSNNNNSRNIIDTEDDGKVIFSSNCEENLSEIMNRIPNFTNDDKLGTNIIRGTMTTPLDESCGKGDEGNQRLKSNRLININDCDKDVLLGSKQKFITNKIANNNLLKSYGNKTTTNNGIISSKSSESMCTNELLLENVNESSNRSISIINRSKSYSEHQHPVDVLRYNNNILSAGKDINNEAVISDKNKNLKSTYQSSIISEVFDGKILSSVQCMTCEQISTTTEVFQDLSLPIPSTDQIAMIRSPFLGAGGGISGSNLSLHLNKAGSMSELSNAGIAVNGGASGKGWFSWIYSWVKGFFWGPVIRLQDCLAAFFSADDLKGDNMYSCDRCKKLRNGIKYSKVLKLPEILCIHLKRFRHEYMFSSKISSFVSFPLERLDMQAHLHKDCKDQVTVYSLATVICHHGTANGGHYTTYALNNLDNNWYEFDDQMVRRVDLQQVENAEAYVLFYRKQDDNIINLRLRASQLVRENNESDACFLRFFISRQWICKFNTFAEPGPINNYDFLCQHGAIRPERSQIIADLTMEINPGLWQFLHDRFGGGPSVNHLSVCTQCDADMRRLRQRQENERNTFISLHDIFKDRSVNGYAVMAISLNWFREWEDFVRGKTDEPPGKIDNRSICQMRNNGTAALMMNSDHGQMSEEIWNFLYDIYGGGPVVLVKQGDLTGSGGNFNNTDE